MRVTTQLGPYTVGEVPPPLVYQYLDNEGALVPINDFLGAFVLLKPDATEGAEERDVEVDEETSSLTYTWQIDDMDAAGTGAGQFWVGSTDGLRKYASEDYEWDIVDGVGGEVPDFGPAS